MSGGNMSARRKWLCDLAFVAVTAASGTALLVAIIVLVYDLRLTGSAADWLATLCNAVVATAAVAAFLVARSWLPQMTTQEGYKTAIALVNDCYSRLGESHLAAVAAAGAMEAYDKVADEELPTTTASYEAAINLFREDLDAALLAPATIKSFRFSLDTYGLTEAPHYKADLETMVEAFEASLPVGQVLLKQLQADLKRRQVEHEKYTEITAWRINATRAIEISVRRCMIFPGHGWYALKETCPGVLLCPKL